MRQFLRRYGRYLLYLPVAAAMAAIGFLVGERRVSLTRPARLPDEVALEHPRIAPAPARVATMPAPEPVPAPEPEVRPHTVRKLSWGGIVVLLIPFIIAIVAIAANSRAHLNTLPAQQVPGGDPGRGKQAVVAFGCGSCHTIAGVPGANGKVGPTIDASLAQRSFIAGKLPNTPDNLIRWIMDPQGVTPGTDMPNMGVPEATARDIAAYFYSLR